MPSRLINLVKHVVVYTKQGLVTEHDASEIIASSRLIASLVSKKGQVKFSPGTAPTIHSLFTVSL